MQKSFSLVVVWNGYPKLCLQSWRNGFLKAFQTRSDGSWLGIKCSAKPNDCFKSSWFQTFVRKVRYGNSHRPAYKYRYPFHHYSLVHNGNAIKMWLHQFALVHNGQKNEKYYHIKRPPKILIPGTFITQIKTHGYVLIVFFLNFWYHFVDWGKNVY